MKQVGKGMPMLFVCPYAIACTGWGELVSE